MYVFYSFCGQLFLEAALKDSIKQQSVLINSNIAFQLLTMTDVD